MPVLTYSEFKTLLKQRDMFSYNKKLVGSTLAGSENPFKGALVLDVGAGTRIKHFKEQLAEARYVVGIDIAYSDLLLNRDVAARAVASGTQLPFAAGTFDCAISVDVVEHLPDPASFFAEVARCLKPGGTLIVCTPNLLGYKNIVSSALPRPVMDWAWRIFGHRQAGQPHRTFYKSNTALRTRRNASSAGMVVVQLEYLDEISHFFYGHSVLCTISYLYGRALSLLHLGMFLNYLVYVLKRPEQVTEESAAMAAIAADTQRSKESLTWTI